MSDLARLIIVISLLTNFTSFNIAYILRQIKDISINELYLWFCDNWHLFQGIADGKVG